MFYYNDRDLTQQRRHIPTISMLHRTTTIYSFSCSLRTRLLLATIVYSVPAKVFDDLATLLFGLVACVLLNSTSAVISLLLVIGRIALTWVCQVRFMPLHFV